MKAWSFSVQRRRYEVRDHGAKFGLEVLRDGFTVWTGFRQGGTLVTDSSALTAGELAAVLVALVEQDPDRRGQEGLFGGFTPTKGPKGRANSAPRPEPVQLGFFGRAPAVVDSAADARAVFSDVGPLFGGGQRRQR